MFSVFFYGIINIGVGFYGKLDEFCGKAGEFSVWRAAIKRKSQQNQ
jgi:hypothetical protein